jgi:hypothetical protein
MKIYYQLPDSDNDQHNKLLGLLYENYRLKMMWKLRSVERQIIKENGCIFIDRVNEGDEERLDLRFEGFSDQLKLVMRGLLSNQVKTKPL